MLNDGFARDCESGEGLSLEKSKRSEGCMAEEGGGRDGKGVTSE